MKKSVKLKKFIETLLFSSRFSLTIFYAGLYIGLLAYAVVFLVQTWHLIMSVAGFNAETIMFGILELVDMSMVASLVKMIITGSYNSFVDKSHGYTNENATSGQLKVKMNTSLIGVSSMYLLKTFLSLNYILHTQLYITVSQQLFLQLGIHGAFLVGGLVLATIDFLHDKGEWYDAQSKVLNCSVETKLHKDSVIHKDH
jgi:uncharacterized protein (TIGR00645 family)